MKLTKESKLFFTLIMQKTLYAYSSIKRSSKFQGCLLGFGFKQLTEGL